ncbi:MAG: hypothetical protein ACLP4W_01805 [Mycobacterium sp.]|uniref:hypothetical protein n=1 Tax=Mycobacterium sp. TaxID=1785 RepID=UPI003F9AA32B
MTTSNAESGKRCGAYDAVNAAVSQRISTGRLWANNVTDTFHDVAIRRDSAYPHYRLAGYTDSGWL